MTQRTINGRQLIWRGHRCEAVPSGIASVPRYRTICGVAESVSPYLSCRQDEWTCLDCALVLDQEKLDGEALG